MKLKVRKIKEEGANYVYPILRNKINALYEQYAFTNISYSQFNEMVKDSINFFSTKLVSLKTEIDEDLILNWIDQNICNYLKNLFNDSNIAVTIITNYINKYLTNQNTSKLAMEEINKLLDFFIAIDYNPTIDILLTVLTQKTLLNDLLQIIYEHDQEKINNLGLNKLYSPNLQILMNSYALFNGITLNLDNNTYDEGYLDTNIINAYLKDIKTASELDNYNSRLTKEEECELMLRAQQGDELARNKIIESHLRLVISIAKRYNHRGLELIDLIQEGNLGLMKAITKYNPNLGYRFSTYATPWIDNYINKAIIDKSSNIRIPVHQVEKIRKLMKLKIELEQQKMAQVSLNDLAIASKMSLQEVKFILQSAESTISLNAIVDEEDTEIGDFIPDENCSLEEDYILKCLPQEVAKLFAKCDLTEREKKIILLRYGFNGEPLSLDAISQKFNITYERTRKIEAKAINKIRSCDDIKDLAIYLPHPTQALTNLELLKKNFQNHSTKKLFNNTSNDSTPKDDITRDYLKKQLINIFAIYPSNYVKLVFPTITESEWELFRRKVFNINWSSELEHEFKEVFLPRVEATIKKIRNTYSVVSSNNVGSLIYERFSEYPKTAIDEVIKKLTPSDQEIIFKKFGPNLLHPQSSKDWTKKDTQTYNNKVIPQIRSLLSAYKKLNSQEIIEQNIFYLRLMPSFYTLFNKSKQEVNNALEKLEPWELSLITKRYGNDLDNPQLGIDWNISDSIIYFTQVIPHLFQILGIEINLTEFNPIYNSNTKSIYDYFKNNYSKDEVNYALSFLSDSYWLNIIRKNGSDLERPVAAVDLKNREKDNFHNVILVHLNKYLTMLFANKNNNVKLNKSLGISYTLQHNPLLNLIVDKLDYFAKLIVALKLGINKDNIILSTSDISNLFGVPESYIIYLAKKVLLEYQNLLIRNNIELDNDEFFKTKSHILER